MTELILELYGVRMSTLQGDWREFDLRLEPDAVTRFGLDSPILSVAVPLALVPTRTHKRRRQNIFRELLPEGRMLARLAQEAHVPEADTIGLLSQNLLDGRAADS